MGNYLVCCCCSNYERSRTESKVFKNRRLAISSEGKTNPEQYSYHIALKNPHGLNYIHYDPYEKKFVSEYNIEDWLSGLYKGFHQPNRYPWEHWIIYNDDPPFIFNQNEINFLKPKATAGHCKGILAWNDYEMSWLIHSVPRFPEYFCPEAVGTDLSGGRVFSEMHYSEEIYGQSFGHFYLSWEKEGGKEMSEKRIRELLEHVRLMEPCVYLSKGFWGTSYSDKWEHLVTRHYHPPKPTDTEFKENAALEENKKGLKCWKGLEGKWEHYAKSPHFEEDFYENLARQKGGCRVESWIRGQKVANSKWVTNNEVVNSLQFLTDEIPPNPLRFKESQDHSKWAISVENELQKIEGQVIEGREEPEKWVCVGDLNRMISQTKRGGGAMVIMDKDLHQAWKTLIGK